MFKLFLISLLSVLAVSAVSQDLEPYEAEELFNKKYYAAVWKYYKDKLKEDSLNTELNYKMGICYLNSRSQKEKAIQYLKRATTLQKNNVNYQALAFKQLGDANYLTGNFDNAIENYEKYRTLTKANPNTSVEDISHEIEMCKMAKELQELKEITAKLVNQKNESRKNRNFSGYEKTGYSISNSSPAFASKKINLKNGHDDSEFFEENNKGYVKNVNQPSKTADSSKTKMETTIASSTDGQIILIYRDDCGEANLYTSVLNGNEWMEPEKLNKVINNSSWEPDEFISSDGNTLYFASKRDGGYGGKDLYKCEKLPGGDWGKAINLGPSINTVYDEEAPFLFPDGATLYFSSNRNRPKGGFDNFTCFFSDSSGWSSPVNIGYPLHETIKSEISQADTNFKKENYISTFISQKNLPITVIKGKIVSDNNGTVPPLIEITVANNETGSTAGVYCPDSKTGKYTCIVPSGINNNVTFEAKGYLFHSENIAIPKDQGYFRLQQPVVLKPISEGSRTVLNNLFFEDGKAVLTSSSELELNRLQHFLKNNPGLRVEISGSVKKKSATDEVKLMESKIQSVINFLTEKGIDKSNIEPMVYKKSKKKKSRSTTQTEENSEKLELKILASK
ncbi:MAG: oprF 5 [Bacteroidetes bacterium]|jgi:tetratricopeptide (TPR) repeat protein/outer membrane protein OmpA-like peptidoglycan-associated protein|nr:oprF 5 [Bacteroidota bacterium]MDF2452881.1 oprF 5 [Bacteroidota bacterium]